MIECLKMAEAFPDDQSDSELPGHSRRIISVLLLASRWQFDTCGLSTVNKSLVNNLRVVDPEGETIKITCAVVEEEGKIKEVDLKNAEKHGVQLRGAQRPRCKKRSKKPELEWLDENTATYYLHLVQDKKYDFIIGHAPYLANGCLNLKGLTKNKNKSPKTVLIFHALPKDENGDVDDEMLLDWLNEVDIVFSLGKVIEDELLAHIAALDPEKRPIHKMYFPSYPLELFTVDKEHVESIFRGTQDVCMMSEDLSLLSTGEEEKPKWKETFEEVLRRKNLNETGLSFKVEAPLTIDKMKIHMRKSNLFLLPLKSNSPLFGTEALAAIAAGVPVLVSRNSGIASLLRKMQHDESVVYKNESEVNTKIWKDRIIQKLTKPDRAQQRANTLREQLLLDTSIAQTHLDFINAIAGTTLVPPACVVRGNVMFAVGLSVHRGYPSPVLVMPGQRVSPVMARGGEGARDNSPPWTGPKGNPSP